jgi:hypothetical protein
MKKADSRIVLPGVILISVLTPLASGCTAPTHEGTTVSPYDFPLLVRFDEKQCPREVVPPSVESCRASTPDAVCREKGKKIIWVAVKGSALDPNQEFTLSGVPARKPTGDSCVQSRAGQLECRIDSKAQGDYKYSVTANGCDLDPRIYVP